MGRRGDGYAGPLDPAPLTRARWPWRRFPDRPTCSARRRPSTAVHRLAHAPALAPYQIGGTGARPGQSSNITRARAPSTAYGTLRDETFYREHLKVFETWA